MEQKSKKSYPWERKFGFYNLKWKITNFLFVSFDHGLVLRSPEFYISGPQLTKWRLDLRRKNVGRHACAVLNLKRSKSDQGPRIVWVQWRTWITCMEKEYFLSEREHRFEKHHSFCMHKIRLNDVILDEEREFVDALEIRCMLIFKPEYECSLNSEACASSEMLSKSPSIVSTSKKLCDLAVVTRDESRIINVHKAVLHYRNHVLAGMIEAREKDGILDLSDAETDELYNVIKFLYTGNIDDAIQRPSFALRELASRLNVTEITGSFILDNLFMETEFNQEEFIHHWKVKNYNSEYKPTRSSRKMRGTFNFCWRLHLGLEDEESRPDYASLMFDVISGELPRMVELEISVLNQNKECVVEKGIIGIVDEDDNMIPLNNFSRKDILQDALANDTLLMRIRVKASVSRKWKTEMFYDNDLRSREVTDCQEKVLLDLEAMFREGKHADLTLEAGNVSFKVHKFILYGRSPVWANMVGDSARFPIPNVDPHVLHVLLSFMYTGLVKDYDYSELFELYKYADFYELEYLRTLCCKLLQEKIDVQAAFNVLKRSEDQKDEVLKHIVMTFIRLNKDEIFQDPTWKESFDIKSPLLRELEMLIESSGR